MIKKIWAWVLLSSKDPQAASLTVKGILTGGIAYVIFFTGIFHKSVSAGDLQSIVDTIANIVGAFLLIVSSFITLIGFIRKMYHTAAGTNAVINTGMTLK